MLVWLNNYVWQGLNDHKTYIRNGVLNCIHKQYTLTKFSYYYTIGMIMLLNIKSRLINFVYFSLKWLGVCASLPIYLLASSHKRSFSKMNIGKAFNFWKKFIKTKMAEKMAA